MRNLYNNPRLFLEVIYYKVMVNVLSKNAKEIISMKKLLLIEKYVNSRYFRCKNDENLYF